MIHFLKYRFTKQLYTYKFVFLLHLLLAVMAYSSCNTQMDEVFDQNANQRIQATLDSCRKTLISAPYGWYLAYTTPTDKRADFLLSFKTNDTVSMYADFDENIVTSTYNLNYGQGPLLTFDTYSPLHTLADPEVKPYGFGYEGDFEFVILSVTPDSIVLSGRKNKDTVVLHKAILGAINKIRLEKQLDLTAGHPLKFFHQLQVNASVCDIMLTGDKKQLEFNTGTGSSERITINYTAQGFDLVNSFTLGAETVQHFEWDDASHTFKLNNLYPITESNIPNFSLGANVDKIRGGLYDVVGYSPAIIAWFSELSTKFPLYLKSEIYFDIPTTIKTVTQLSSGNDTTSTNVNMIAYSFLFSKPDVGIVWSNFKGTSISMPREDRILIKQGARDGEDADNLYANFTTRNITSMLFNSTGLTVYTDGAYVYIINTKESKNWLKLKKSDKMVVEQINYVNY